MHELDLMSRELDQLEAALPSTPTDTPGPTAEAPWSTFEPGVHDASVSRPSRSLVVVLAAVVAIALVVAGVVYVGLRATDIIGEAPSTGPGHPAQPGAHGNPDSPGSTVPARQTPARRLPGRRTP